MKTAKIAIIALMLLSFVVTAEAGSSKKKKSKQSSAEPQSKVITIANGPKSDPSKSICPPCPNFSCTAPSPTAPSGCTGPNCTGCTPTPFCCVTIDNSVISETTLNIAGGEILGDALVQLNVNVKEDLTVEEDSIFVNNVCIEADKNVCENVSIEGFGVVLGKLTVESGGINATGTITVTGGNVFVNGSVNVTGNQNVTGSLDVGGTGQFNNTLIASGGLQVFNGSTINSGGLIINNPSGCSGCTGAFINGNVCVIGNVIANDVDVASELIVDEIATLNNVFTATGGTLITNGTVVMNDGLTITGDEVMNGGSKFVGGDLSVSGSSLFESPVTSNSGAMISGGVIVNGGSTVDSLAITSGNLSVSGTLDVNGSITSENGITILRSLTLTSTENSLCPSGPEGALVVLGGAGIGASGVFGRDLWLGGAEYFANTEAEGGTPSSFDYYEETCYSTAFTWGGLTVNPPAYVPVKVIRVGNIVNLLIPEIIYNNPGIHIDVITSTNPMPERFRPFVTVRGASSTIISNFPTSATESFLIGGLGEYNISPAGIITFGIPATASGPLGPTATDALGPQRIFSVNFVEKDIDSITYNINNCDQRCKIPCT